MTNAPADLAFLSATEALDQFRKKELSPVDLMQAVIARCEAVNPKVNAITYKYFDRALEQARASEGRYTAGCPQGALDGLPLAVKDLHPMAGEITTSGSRIFADHRPEQTLPYVQRLLDAGAIVHMRTTTPEFAHTIHCHSPLWGATRNPWNLAYTSGGSSGGAAASVAAGMTILAEGDDGGGSIRVPASVCGVFGFKPSFGRNPASVLPTNNDWHVHLGPITRSVDDAILMQNVTSGPHPDDASSLRPKLEIPHELGPVSGWKVALSMDLGYFTVDRKVRENTLRAADVFRSLGCEIVEVKLPWTEETYLGWMTHWEGLLASVAGQHMARADELDPFVRKLIERGLKHSFTHVKRFEFLRAQMYRQLSPIMEECRILLCPTTAVASVDALHRCDDESFSIEGKHVDAFLMWCMTYPFNMLGQMPVASVPSGFSNEGVPTGVQIVGRTYDDISVLQAAKAYERALPWRSKRPGV